MNIAKAIPPEDIRDYANNIAKALIELLPDGKKVVFPLIGNSFTLACERKENQYCVYHINTDTHSDFPKIYVSAFATTADVATRSLSQDLYNWITAAESVPSPVIVIA